MKITRFIVALFTYHPTFLARKSKGKKGYLNRFMVKQGDSGWTMSLPIGIEMIGILIFLLLKFSLNYGPYDWIINIVFVGSAIFISLINIRIAFILWELVKGGKLNHKFPKRIMLHKEE